MAEINTGRKPFILLTDVPNSYTTFGNDVVTVKPTEDGLQFTTPGAIVGDHRTLTNRNAVGQHSSESAGVLSPYSINHLDVGTIWLNTLASSSIGNNPVTAIVDIGNGICMAGSTGGATFRSQNYGKDWASFASPSSDDIASFAYAGNGNLWIATTGNISGTSNIFRSLNFGNRLYGTVLAIAGVNFTSIAYIGNGIGILTDASGNAYRTINYGSFWSGVPGNPQIASPLNVVKYIENQIILLGSNNGHILISANLGGLFTDEGQITLGGGIRTIEYLSNGVVLAGDDVGFVYRSTDFGITWSAGVQVTIAPNPCSSLLYTGNGIVLAFQGGDGAHIFRSNDYGLSWLDLGPKQVNPGFFLCSAYLGNGIVVAGTNGQVPFPGPIQGTIFRSDVAFKYDESQNFIHPRIETFTFANNPVGLNFTHTTVLIDATGGAMAVNLPSAGISGTIDLRGHIFNVKKIDATANVVTVTPQPGQNIDNNPAGYALAVQYQNVAIQSDGTNWWVI